MEPAAVVTARAVVCAGSLIAAAVAAQTVRNLRVLPSPTAPDAPVREQVSVLVPARDEAAHVGATIASALAQRGVADLEVVVLDDASADATGDIVDAAARADARVVALHNRHEPPPGWLGKPWACAQLAEAAHGTVLVFVDADVTLTPDAVAACVRLLRDADLAMVAPYPRQVVGSWLERLTQPLVTWAWVALLPLAWQQRSTRPSLSAANGQLLVVDADAYRAAGGHDVVRDRVVEDVALMAALRRSGSPAWTVDGSRLARCRMYDGPGAVVDGYAKSLSAAFGGPLGSVAVTGVLVLAFVVPAAATALARDPRTRAIALAGYGAGVLSRALVARRTGEPVLDAVGHPGSVLAFAALSAVSWVRRVRGTARWKGRPVVVAS